MSFIKYLLKIDVVAQDPALDYCRWVVCITEVDADPLTLCEGWEGVDLSPIRVDQTLNNTLWPSA